VLHAFASQTTVALKHWIDVRPHNALTVLDTHDGIGIVDIGPEGEKPGLVEYLRSIWSHPATNPPWALCPRPERRPRSTPARLPRVIPMQVPLVSVAPFTPRQEELRR
jgi:hypothetical protein